MLTINEHTSTNYKQRTLINASISDLTVAFAVDFSTAGERCTKSAAKDKYLDFRVSKKDSRQQYAGVLLRQIKNRDARILNIAGNGIYTLSKHGWTQDEANQYVFDILEGVRRYREDLAIVCGGQTGFDIAGAVAGSALNLDVAVVMPKGFRQRDADGVDRMRTADEIECQIKEGVGRLHERS